MTISKEILDELLQSFERPEDLLGDSGSMKELKNCGLQDALIAVVDSLKGFPEAMVKICFVHLVRHSRNLCSWKESKIVAADLRRIYSAPSA